VRRYSLPGNRHALTDENNRFAGSTAGIDARPAAYPTFPTPTLTEDGDFADDVYLPDALYATRNIDV